MAALEQQDGRKNHGVKRSKKLSTRIDLTPMVDLGFLLITFFIFTNTLNESKAMGLILPADRPNADPMLTAENKTISFILCGDNKICYYHGLDMNDMAATDYSAKGIRAIIQQKQKAVAAKYGNGKDLVVLIKPTDKSSYGNVVNVLDEMLINGVGKYVLMDAGAKELALVEKRLKNN